MEKEILRKIKIDIESSTWKEIGKFLEHCSNYYSNPNMIIGYIQKSEKTNCIRVLLCDENNNKDKYICSLTMDDFLNLNLSNEGYAKLLNNEKIKFILKGIDLFEEISLVIDLSWNSDVDKLIKKSEDEKIKDIELDNDNKIVDDVKAERT